MPVADHPSSPDADDVPIDEVARQRQRREDRLLANPLVDAPELSLGEVIDSVLAAREELATPLDLDRFLADNGHGWRTIEAVKTYLDACDRAR